MDDVNRAYDILGVKPTMSLEEIEGVYEELLQKYEHLAEDNMYYQEKLVEWDRAFDCIIEHRIDIADDSDLPNEGKRSSKFLTLMAIQMIFLGFISVTVFKEFDELKLRPLSSDSPGIYELSTNFKLSLCKFSEFDNWDWGYYEEDGEWVIVVAVEVSKAAKDGALINATNFRLEEDYPTTYITKEIYSDEDLNQVHYLGNNSELVKVNEKFGVVFQVEAFEQGEERVLYYYHPDGSKHEVGRLIFDVFQESENPGIFI